MGARPAWALLALTLPQADESWLEEFATGLGNLARAHGVALVGGDTTRGPLCISVQLLGHVPAGEGLSRGGGQAGDVLFVTGTCGDAAAGLAIEQGELVADADPRTWLRERFLWPTPRVALGERLRGLASACIDVSDGLLTDAGKLASASHAGAELAWAEVPLSQPLLELLGEMRARELALTGGDDYELCFAVPPQNIARLTAQLPPEEWRYKRIGLLRAEPGAVAVRDGTVMEFSHSGYEHFR
jgi:thiamine-monophosphate kinase